MNHGFALGVDTREIRALTAAFKASPEMVQRELRVFMGEAVGHLKDEAQARTPTTHGTLRSSIIGNVRPVSGFGVEGVVGSSLGYAVAVELGTRPHMPPVEPLIDWVSQKFGLRGKEAKAAAWRVAKGIARHGTPAVGMFHGAFNSNKAQLAERFSETVQRITRQLGKDVR